jgi:hypothetical protein
MREGKGLGHGQRREIAGIAVEKRRYLVIPAEAVTVASAVNFA